VIVFQVLFTLARLFEVLHWAMWVALVLVPLWFAEKAVLAAAAAIARTDPTCNDVERNSDDVA